MTQYQILMRQKRAKGGLDKDETRALNDARADEFIRRHDALYARGLLNRRFAKLGCAIREAFKLST